MHRLEVIVLLAAVGLGLTESAEAWQGTSSQPVVIHRKMISLTPPDAYRSAFSLRASGQLTLTAAFEGQVLRTPVSQGKKVSPQTELVTIDSGRLDLMHARALAAVKLAESELRVATIGRNADQIQLGEAKLALAQADLKLVEFDQQQTSFRAPFEGTVLKVHVTVGEQVRKGTPLVTFGNVSVMECRVPVDRKTAQKDQPITLTVEDEVLVGVVQAIDPVKEGEQKLRDLAVSVAVATVAIRNQDGRLKVGQAVYPTLLPEDPVTRVPLDSVKSGTSGDRVVKVLRDHVVRDVPVRLHGQIGKADIFVSGPFTENDLVITSSSVELADSTAVRPSASTRAGGTTGASPTAPVSPAAGSTSRPARSGAAGF